MKTENEKKLKILWMDPIKCKKGSGRNGKKMKKNKKSLIFLIILMTEGEIRNERWTAKRKKLEIEILGRVFTKN